jgi:phospholipid-binding lipoprotein MlaA
MRALLALALVAVLAGCAARRPPDVPEMEYDPWQSVNRKVFRFNDAVDTWVLEPTARGWDTVLPNRVQRSVSNFFWNLRFPIVVVNELLQGSPLQAGEGVARFAVNTTVGVLGFFDPAAGWGLERNDEDFGQTLAVWGVPSGPYLVLPLLGASNPRDAVGLAVDSALGVTPWFVDWWILGAARVVDVVNERSLVLEEVEDFKRSALDLYSSIRNGYAQRRRDLIRDGAEPGAEETEELYTLPPGY